MSPLKKAPWTYLCVFKRVKNAHLQQVNSAFFLFFILDLEPISLFSEDSFIVPDNKESLLSGVVNEGAAVTQKEGLDLVKVSHSCEIDFPYLSVIGEVPGIEG